MRVLLAFCFCLLVFHANPAARAQTTLPNGVTLRPVASGIVQPVCVSNAGDGSGRLFVCDRTGKILVMQNEVLQAQPFMDISARVNPAGEGGLLGLAFPAGFANSGRFYVYYSNLAGDIVISLFIVQNGVGNPNSEIILLTIPHRNPANPAQQFFNHYGGGLHFGPDGLLYASVGDGGGGGDPFGSGQNPNTHLGKIVRLDVESQPGTAVVPAGNPLPGGPAPFIWALGLRNPFRFSFDRTTGDMWIGDVGQSVQEEIDFIPQGTPGGRNLGWNVLEGNACFSPAANCVQPAEYLPPIHVYGHEAGRCSVTGGHVYRGAAWPALAGVYFFADFCTGEVFGLRPQPGGGVTTATLAVSPFRPVSFGESEAGELYMTSFLPGQGLGQIHAIELPGGPGAASTTRGVLLIPAAPR